MNKLLQKFAVVAAMSLILSPLVMPTQAQAGANLSVVFATGAPPDPLFNESNFLPGDAVTKWAKITNKTTGNQSIVAKLSGYTDPDNLGGTFDVVVKKHGAPGNLFVGTMTAFAALSELVLNPAMVPNVEEQYDFSVTFRPETGNPYQEKTLGFDLLFQIQGQDTGRYIISGMKFNDKNGNGAQEEGDTGLPGWTIAAVSKDPVASVNVDSTVPAGADTAALPVGQYLVKVSGAWVNQNNPQEFFDAEYYTQDNWSNHTDGTTGYSGAGVDEGDLMLNQAFVSWGAYAGAHSYYLLYTQAAPGPINFSVFDGDALTGIKNASWYADNSGSLNVDVFAVYDTAITDNSGNYSLSVADSISNIQIYEINKNGWTQTFPESGHYSLGLDGDVTGKNFGNHQTDNGGCTGDCGGEGTGGITGIVYNDANNNGQLDSGESPLSGWIVYLDSNDNGQLDSGEPSKTTDASGNYAFTGLSAGNYTVRQITQSGWTQTMPTADGGKYPVTVNNVTVVDKNFGNFTSGGGCTSNCGGNGGGNNGGGGGGGGGSSGATVMGQKFNDLNRNGQKDVGEPGLPNWTIYFDINNNNALDSGEPFTLTDSSGNYTFFAVSSGNITVREVQQPGWTQTFPAAAQDFETLLNVISGGSYTANFGNGQGEVAGASTIGTNLPQVAGAITELPKTGLPPRVWIYLAALAIVASTFGKKRASLENNF